MVRVALALSASPGHALPPARHWLEFPDPEQLGELEPHEVTQVFRVDITWLSSRWACVYGRGCRGIVAASPHAGCCALGAHFTDADDEARVALSVQRLDDTTWQRRGTYAQTWAEDDDGERTTQVVDGACVFLNDPDFPRPGCALHHLAQIEGTSGVVTKPDVCWQLPLRRSYREVTRADGSTYLEVTISEYDRLGWGAGGLDLDWYCTDAPEAHVSPEPLYLSCETELRELVGAAAYDVIAAACATVSHPMS